MWLVLLWSCADGPTDVPEASAPRSSTPLERLRRGSLALRGYPPEPHEVEAVHRGDDWMAVVGSWRSNPALGEVAADVVAEALGLRFDAQPHVPSLGPLASVPPATLIDRLDEAPLRLVAHIATSGRPFTEIVTTDEVLADPVVSRAYGPPVDEADESWQVTRWTDGRPAAGILSSSSFAQRHPIAPTNHQRSRAAIVMEGLLCDDMGRRPEAGSVRPVQQDAELQDDPVCMSCHATLDPIAANFEGFRRYVVASEVREGYATDCAAGFCYPLPMFDPALTLTPGVLLPPGYYGRSTQGLADLGRTIADDDRFATCMVRRFFGHLTGLDWADVEGGFVDELAAGFRDADHDVRELLVAIATHEAFAPESPHAPPSFLTPRQWARAVEQLVGVRATALPNPGYGPIDLVETDRFGLNQGLGGTEGWRLVPADRGALPSRELGLRWLAEEAAAAVLERERGGGADWFARGFALTGDDARAQLVDWHLRVLAEVVGPHGPEVDADLALLGILARDRSPEEAWAGLLAAFLQHPRLVVQ